MHLRLLLKEQRHPQQHVSLHQIAAFVFTMIIILPTIVVAQTRAVRSDTNFACGGARTDDKNRRVVQNSDEFEGPLDDAGLTLLGLQDEIDYAFQTLDVVDPDQDIFLISCGSNDFDRFRLPHVSVDAIRDALDRLYLELGARKILVMGLQNIARAPLFEERFSGSFNPLRTTARGIARAWTYSFNLQLRDQVAKFDGEHPDVRAIFVDIFQTAEDRYEDDDVFFNDGTCQDGVDFDENPFATCEGYAFLDDVHPTSALWEPVAELLAEKLFDNFQLPYRRFITFGESFFDMGMYNNVWLRSFFQPENPPPLYFQGRYTDGLNVIDQTELLIGPTLKTTFFELPKMETITLKREVSFSTDLAATYWILSRIPVPGVTTSLNITYNRNSSGVDAVTCIYSYDNSGDVTTHSYSFQSCDNQNYHAGSLINNTGTIEVFPYGDTVNDVTTRMNLLFYDFFDPRQQDEEF